MDLLAISRTVWRHKLATVPVILITLIGMAYVLVVKKPIYQAQSSYILLPARTLPPTGQASQSPAVKGVNANNPFTSYGDLSIVVDLLTEVMSSPAEGHVLASQGVKGQYTVAPLNTAYGNAPIMQITARGPSPAAAIASATVIGNAVQSQLASIQASQGTSKRYWIGSLQLSRPDQAQQQISSKLRDLVAVVGIGMILLFIVVSTMNAREERKRERQGAGMDFEEQNGRPVRVAEPDRARVADSKNGQRDAHNQVVGLEQGRRWSFDSQVKQPRISSGQRQDA